MMDKQMETQIDQQPHLEEAPSTPADDEIFTINRNVINYILIAIVFFVLGGLAGVMGHARTVDSNEEIIMRAVDAAYIRQEATLNEIIEAGALSGSSKPSANEFADDDPFVGPEDASVVIVEFSDFNCAFCKRFKDTTLQPLLDEYGDQIRFVYRDFAILGETSLTSAIAAECADDQGRFWDYHDLLFENQGNFSQDSLIGYAEQLELEIDTFTTCLEKQTFLGDVRVDSAAAQQIGAQGTPAFLINDQFISGAQPYEVFAQIIDTELARIAEDNS